MADQIENHMIELVWLPRVSNRQLGTRVFGLPNQMRTLQYKMLLVRSGHHSAYRVDGVYPVGDHPTGLSERERLDIKDLLDVAIRDKLPTLLIRAWNSSVIGE